MTGSPRVITAINHFRHTHSKIVCAMHNPWLASGECGFISCLFAEGVRQHTPDAACELTVVEGHGVPPGSIDTHIYWDRFWHMLTRVDGQYVDWTYRQVIPTAPVPFVCDEDEIRRIWSSVRSAKPIDLL